MHIDTLMKFCGDKDSQRFSKPWSLGDRTYASNGFILISVPRMEDVPKRECTVNLTTILGKNPVPQEGWVDAPDIAGLNVRECPRCKGKERPSELCEECAGEGVVKFETYWNSYDWECKSCRGDGAVGKCQPCGNTGYLINEDLVEIGGSMFKTAVVLDLVRAFGPLQFAPPGEGGCCWIRFEGGFALIMPLKTAGAA